MINQLNLDLIRSGLLSDDPEAYGLACELLNKLDTPYYTFKPRPDALDDQQTSFITDHFEGLACVIGGNGSGKDYCSGWKVTDFILNNPPPLERTPYWVLSKTMEMVGQDCWVQSLSNWIPPDQIEAVAWHREKLHYPSAVVLKPHANGNQWVLQFKSYDQGREALQGANIGGFYCSEQCPLPLLREIIARTRKWTFPGSQIYNATPLEPDVELEEIWKDQANYPTWKFYSMSTRAAANYNHVTQNYIQQIVENELIELIETRLSGAFASFQGAIYRHFKPSKHVIKPFAIPKGYLHTRGLDLGFNDPTFCVWVAKSPDGINYIYREYCANQTLIAEHVNEINKGWDYTHPGYGPTWCDHDAQDIAEFMAHGLKNILRAWKSSKLAGISILQHMFKDDKIFIFDNCKTLISNLRSYCWDTKKRDEPRHLDSHGPDALRYCLCSVQPTSVLIPAKVKPVVDPNPYDHKFRNPYKSYNHGT